MPSNERSPRQQFIGIDVGGTKILGVDVDPGTGTILERRQEPTPRHDPAGLARAIGDVAESLIDAGRAAGRGLPTAIGVGVPGLVDHQGVLHYGANVPDVLGLDIAGELRSRFGLPATADNDASNAALAEHRLGAARGHEHAVIITQGTGIGGALIIGGRLLRGANGFAGEPGHMLVDRHGHRCACGRVGCWETVSSGAGLRNLAREVINEGRGARILELAGGDISRLRGEHVSAALAEGDTDAATVMDRFATWVAAGIGSLITLLDPEIVVLGGGLAAVNQHFIGDVRARLTDHVLGGPHRPVVPIVSAQLGPEAGAIGAAISARDVFLGG